MAEKEKVNPDKVQSGDLMGLVYWVKVRKNEVRNKNHALEVADVATGNVFEVYGDKLIEESYSADQYNKEKKVTATELAEVFITAINKPFTVWFTKANGELRKLRGKYVSHEALMGRSHVIDLDVDKGTPLRLVDHRNIESLIVDGVKYVLKKK